MVTEAMTPDFAGTLVDNKSIPTLPVTNVEPTEHM